MWIGAAWCMSGPMLPSKYVNEEGANRNSLALVQQSISLLTWPQKELNQNSEDSIAEETHVLSA